MFHVHGLESLGKQTADLRAVSSLTGLMLSSCSMNLLAGAKLAQLRCLLTSGCAYYTLGFRSEADSWNIQIRMAGSGNFNRFSLAIIIQIWRIMNLIRIPVILLIRKSISFSRIEHDL